MPNGEKIISLNKNKSFRYVYGKGKSLVSPVVVTYVVKNKLNINRLGITTSKKVGNAVKRNRAKRIIKAAYNVCKDNIKIGYDIVFVARARTAESNSNEIYFFINKHLSKLGILKNKD